jgi:glycosyltransferase involved in cell wall biosynthesis
LCRDLDGFFDHVWTVHPALGASPTHSHVPPVGPPTRVEFAPRHTVIEGPVARFAWRGRLPRLNFLIAQSVLVARLLRVVRQERVSVIRVSDPYYAGLLGLLIARVAGLPLVVRINANQDLIYDAVGETAYPRLFRWRAVEKRIERFVLERGDLVAAGNENNRQFALANGARPERSTVFRAGVWVDPVHFKVEPEKRRSIRLELGLGDRPFVVIVGRLERLKHPEDVLHVLVEAKARQPDLAAVFVGDGRMRGDLEALAAELGVADDVQFAGSRDQEWVAAALTSATVVLSALTGRVLVEACLSGTPVVAYDVEWHFELVSNGETGILVPYRDTHEMADAVCDLVSDPARAALLGKKARAVALEMMNPTRLMQHERNEYVKLLEGKMNRRRLLGVR